MGAYFIVSISVWYQLRFICVLTLFVLLIGMLCTVFNRMKRLLAEQDPAAAVTDELVSMRLLTCARKCCGVLFFTMPVATKPMSLRITLRTLFIPSNLR